MKRFVQAEDRTQGTLLPEHLDDYVGADNPVRVVDVFVEYLDLRNSDLQALTLWRQGVLHTIPQFCSSCTSTATSTGFNPAGDWNAKHNAILN